MPRIMKKQHSGTSLRCSTVPAHSLAEPMLCQHSGTPSSFSKAPKGPKYCLCRSKKPVGIDTCAPGTGVGHVSCAHSMFEGTGI